VSRSEKVPQEADCGYIPQSLAVE